MNKETKHTLNETIVLLREYIDYPEPSIYRNDFAKRIIEKLGGINERDDR